VILLMMVDTPEEKRKFVILYENYRYLMLKVAVDILHDYQLAEDAVQEAFVRVAKHMENVGQPEETATKRYLITITKHAAIDLYRRRNRLQSREIYMDELPEETGQLTYMAPEEEHGVLDILKNLPPKYRDIFLLKYSTHLENWEIARICGLREGTIRQRIARGKRLIEKELEKIKKGDTE
jgi:RNA polymerase sigma-70 factor (ECF subfamily)